MNVDETILANLATRNMSEILTVVSPDVTDWWWQTRVQPVLWSPAAPGQVRQGGRCRVSGWRRMVPPPNSPRPLFPRPELAAKYTLLIVDSGREF